VDKAGWLEHDAYLIMSAIPHRPPRPHQIHPALRPFYFITFNTHRRRALLQDPRIHERFVSFVTNARSHGVAVGRYVLMPDHLHLFIALPQTGITLSRWIQSLRSALSRELRAMGHAPPYWQEGFFDHLMRSSESYAEKWAYVQMNPVRAGLVARPEEWPYQGEIERITF
jgi:putative transposase